jgi:hypothetical protein
MAISTKFFFKKRIINAHDIYHFQEEMSYIYPVNTIDEINKLPYSLSLLSTLKGLDVINWLKVFYKPDHFDWAFLIKKFEL